MKIYYNDGGVLNCTELTISAPDLLIADDELPTLLPFYLILRRTVVIHFEIVFYHFQNSTSCLANFRY